MKLKQALAKIKQEAKQAAKKTVLTMSYITIAVGGLAGLISFLFDKNEITLLPLFPLWILATMGYFFWKED